MNTRPTPETDVEEIIITKGKPTHWVPQEFARRLERERDEWKAKYIDLKSQLTQTQGCVTISRNGYVQELERERDEAREQRDKAREIYQKSYTAELARANHYKQERDRLAEALEDIRARCQDKTIELHPDSDAKGCVDDCLEWSEQALQSLTTNEEP